jgi:hypothetical protein
VIWNRIAFTVLVTCTVGCPAAAQQLDLVLPADVPGYDSPFAISLTRQGQPAEPETGIVRGGAALAPSVAVQAGYDSAPNGQAGSPFASLAPSVTLTDTQIGLGAYAGVTAQDEFTDSAQNTDGRAAALGLRLAGATQTPTLAAGYLATQETGFALGTPASPRPIAFSVADARAQDELSFGSFTVTPAVSNSAYRFPTIASENRTDTREALTVKYSGGGPGSVIVSVHATQSPTRDVRLSAGTQEALAGLADTQSALWTWRLLGGFARRRARQGGVVTAPVLEAALDWAPARADRVGLLLAHEIDDPDQINAAGYRLTEARATLRHDGPGGITLQGEARVQDAAIIGSALREVLVGTDIGARWLLSPELSLAADYAFNDRQANRLRAANEHVVTMGLTWTP